MKNFIRLLLSLVIMVPFKVSSINIETISLSKYGKKEDLNRKVLYMNKAIRKQYRLKMKKGRFYYHQDGKKYAKNTGRYIVDPRGNFYFFDHTQKSADEIFKLKYEFYHSSFLAGKPVAGGGWIRLSSEGKVLAISNGSGHYRPPEKLFLQTINLLYKKGVNYPFFVSLFSDRRFVKLKDQLEFLTPSTKDEIFYIKSKYPNHPFQIPTYHLEEIQLDAILCCEQVKAIEDKFTKQKNIERYLSKYVDLRTIRKKNVGEYIRKHYPGFQTNPNTGYFPLLKTKSSKRRMRVKPYNLR